MRVCTPIPDTRCAQFGDCCSDYDSTCVQNQPPTICSSCLPVSELESTYLCYGHCGSQAPEGCWCDDLCVSFGDW